MSATEIYLAWMIAVAGYLIGYITEPAWRRVAEKVRWHRG